MNVSDVRAMLDGLPDDMPVKVAFEGCIWGDAFDPVVAPTRISGTMAGGDYTTADTLVLQMDDDAHWRLGPELLART